MSDTTVQTATAEPAPVAQTPVEKKDGASNTSQSDFARKLAAKQTAPAIFQAPPTIEAKPVETKTGEATEAPAAEAKEPEAKTETPEATETEAEEVLSPEQHSLDPKLQEKINRRIGKEVAKRKALEQEVASLRALVTQPVPAEKEEVIVHAPANVPLAEITTLTQLEQLKANAKQEIRWVEQWLDEDIPAEGIQTDRGLATKRQLKEIRRNAVAVQEDLIPQRENFLKTRQTSAQTALEKFPFLKDPTHPGYQLAQQAKRDPANAWLQSLPNADYVLGVQIKGILAMQAEEAAKDGTPAKVVVKPKPRPTNGQGEVASDSSTSRAPIGMMDRMALEQARKTATGGKKSLGHKDFAALLRANQQFRNS